MSKSTAKSPFEAAKTIFDTLESLDEATRSRVLVSALSLLGMDPVQVKVASALAPELAPREMPSRSTSSQGRPVSPVELVEQKQPSTNAQRLAVFAYYREKVEGISRFSKGDLKAYFPKARLTKPQNYDRDFASAVQLGYIYEDGAESYLTSKGLEAVEVGFGGRGQPRGIAVSKKKQKAKRSRGRQ